MFYQVQDGFSGVAQSQEIQGMVFMMSCRRFTRLAARGDLAKAGWRTRCSAQLHVLCCRHCRRYVAQLEAINSEARRLYRASKELAFRADSLERRILSNSSRRPKMPPASKSGVKRERHEARTTAHSEMK